MFWLLEILGKGRHLPNTAWGGKQTGLGAWEERRQRGAAPGLGHTPRGSLPPRKPRLSLSRLCRFGGEEGGDEVVRSEGHTVPAATRAPWEKGAAYTPGMAMVNQNFFSLNPSFTSYSSGEPFLGTGSSSLQRWLPSSVGSFRPGWLPRRVQRHQLTRHHSV